MLANDQARRLLPVIGTGCRWTRLGWLPPERVPDEREVAQTRFAPMPTSRRSGGPGGAPGRRTEERTYPGAETSTAIVHTERVATQLLNVRTSMCALML